MEKLGSHWTDFHEILYLGTFRKSVDKIQFSVKFDKITVTLHENRYTCLIISRCILLRMRNIATKICTENQNTFHFQWLPLPPPPKLCRLWKNVENNCRAHKPQITIWRMRIACWIPKATNTHWEYVILIAFPLQQCLRERAAMLHYAFIVCLVVSSLSNYSRWWNRLREGRARDRSSISCGKKRTSRSWDHLAYYPIGTGSLFGRKLVSKMSCFYWRI